MTTCPRPAACVLPVAVVVRRKRKAGPGLPLPPHLLPDAVWADPDRWRQGRFAWSKQYQWPPGRIGFLAFFLETVKLHSDAKGYDHPKV